MQILGPLPRIISACVVGVAVAAVDDGHFSSTISKAGGEIPPFVPFGEPLNSPASLIIGEELLSPPYNVGSDDDDVLLPGGGCNGLIASHCSIELAVRLVTKARALTCPILTETGELPDLLEVLEVTHKDYDTGTNFGVFVMDSNFTMLADRLRPDLEGSPFDGLRASGQSVQPRLRERIQWVVGGLPGSTSSGGFVPHTSTRLSIDGETPASVSTYLERCPNGSFDVFFGLSLGVEGLLGEEQCNPTSNFPCNIRNAQRVLGLSLLDFLSIKDEESYTRFLYDVAYTDKYASGGLGVTIAQSSRIQNTSEELSLLNPTWSTVLADYGNHSQHGRNASELALAAASAAAFRGGGWFKHEVPNSDGGSPTYQVGYAVGVVFGNTAHAIWAGFAHSPKPTETDFECTTCAPNLTTCAVQTLEYLSSHSQTDFLAAANETEAFWRITNLQWLGATHEDAQAQNTDPTWPSGFSTAVFDSEGYCVADGSSPAPVGMHFDNFTRYRLSSDGYTEQDWTGTLWGLLWLRATKGYGWFRYNESGPRLAKTTYVRRPEEEYLLLSSISAERSIVQNCDFSEPSPCVAQYIEAEVAHWVFKLATGQSIEWTLAAQLLDEFLFNETMWAGIYNPEWTSIVPRDMASYFPSANLIEDLTIENVQLLEEGLSSGGGWISLKDDSESFVDKAYLLPVHFKDNAPLYYFVAGFKGARKAPTCESGCGEAQVCGENGRCLCPSYAYPSVGPVYLGCGPIPASALFCSSPETGCSNASDLLACNTCREGYYCPTNYVEYECPVGFYCPKGSRTPVPCQVGTWSADAMATNYTDCDPCMSGYYRGSSMLNGCQVCPVGSYQPEGGQSECIRCERGHYQNSTGQTSCFACTNDRTTQGLGFTSSEDCVCPPGTFTSSNASGDALCVPCGEGSFCGGFGEAPVALPGYYLHEISGELSIFHCLDQDFCPGGVLKSCAEGRTGIACAECLIGKTPDRDGSCRDCVFLDRTLLLGAALVFVGGLTVLYYGVATADRSKQNHAMLLVIISGSQIVTMVQTLNVLSAMEVDWGSPLTAFLSRFTIVSFDLSELRLSCWFLFSPLQTYILRLTTPLAAVAFVSIIHFLSTVFHHGSHLGARLHLLLASVGSVFMAFCISIVLATLQPAQCTDHPNGRWTMRSEMSELCWEGSSHRAMIATAWLASFVPLTFVAAVVHILLAFPRRIREGDVRFLSTCMFLVFRYKPGARWCSLFLIIRNMLVAIVPAVWDPVTQVVSLQILSMAGLVIVLHYRPCRVAFATVSEAGLCMGTLFAGSLGSFFVANPDRGWVTRLAMGVLVVMSLLFPIGVSVGLMRYVRALRARRFHFFLCHHKVGSGALARLTKMELCRGRHALKGDVFIDSDNLENLDKLFNVVAHETHTLVAFCSAELFRRPWCIGEVTTAYNSKVRVVPLYLTDFSPITDDFIQDIASVVDLGCVIEHGYSLELVQTALYWTRSLGGLTMPAAVDTRVLRELAKALIHRSSLSPSHTLALHGIVGGRLRPEPLLSHQASSPQSSTERSTTTAPSTFAALASLAKVGTNASTTPSGPFKSAASSPSSAAAVLRNSDRRPAAAFVVDTESCEAVCAARILIDLVNDEVGQAMCAPRLLQDAMIDRNSGLELLPSVDRLALLCTVGCWSSHRFITDAVHGFWTGLEMLPVIVDENYRFPTDSFYRELEDVGSCICRMYDVREQPDVFRNIVVSIFKNIASHFHVLGGLDILQTQAQAIKKRLKKPLLDTSKSSNDGTCSVDERAWCHDFVRVVTNRWDTISEEDYN